MVTPLIAWSLRRGNFTQTNTPPPADDRAQLYLFARSPESFHVTTPGLDKEVGYVLYHFDLFKPGTPWKL
jgi:hypothetical protein